MDFSQMLFSLAGVAKTYRCEYSWTRKHLVRVLYWYNTKKGFASSYIVWVERECCHIEMTTKNVMRRNARTDESEPNEVTVDI